MKIAGYVVSNFRNAFIVHQNQNGNMMLAIIRNGTLVSNNEVPNPEFVKTVRKYSERENESEWVSRMSLSKLNIHGVVFQRNVHKTLYVV